MRRRKIALGAVVGAVLLGLTITGASASTGDPLVPPADTVRSTQARDDARVSLSESLSHDSSVDDVLPAVAEHIFEHGSGRGFAGQVTDYDRRALTVYWSGSVPDDIREFIDSKPYGVTIDLLERVPHSRAEGETARERLTSDSLTRELGIVSISVRANGAGLEVGTTRTTPFTAEQLESLKRLAGMDVSVNYGLSEPQGYPATIAG